MINHERMDAINTNVYISLNIYKCNRMVTLRYTSMVEKDENMNEFENEKQLLSKLNKLYTRLTILRDWDGKRFKASYTTHASTLEYIDLSVGISQTIVNSEENHLLIEIAKIRKALGLDEREI